MSVEQLNYSVYLAKIIAAKATLKVENRATVILQKQIN